MVFGFVKQSGGRVKIYSELGRGTSVKLYLPRAGQHDEIEALDIRTNVAISSKGETIMVVEDDPALRQLVVTLLTDLGYRTLDADDGMAALDLVDGGAQFDLLLTDVVLPKGISGPTLAAAALKAMPELRVLYMSGLHARCHAAQPRARRGRSPGDEAVPKARSGTQIRELLDAPGKSPA